MEQLLITGAVHCLLEDIVLVANQVCKHNQCSSISSELIKACTRTVVLKSETSNNLARVIEVVLSSSRMEQHEQRMLQSSFDRIFSKCTSNANSNVDSMIDSVLIPFDGDDDDTIRELNISCRCDICEKIKNEIENHTPIPDRVDFISQIVLKNLKKFAE